MMNGILKIFLLGCLPTFFCLPFHEDHGDVSTAEKNFVGRSTNEIAAALLKGYVVKEENMVYSPFGYSAIMAIFSEGANGASREEIASALHFPKNVQEVRENYKRILERFVEKKNSNAPEFKNWFYIYKNFSVKEDLQDVLRKYYLTEVKFVDRPEDYFKEADKVPITQAIKNSKKPSSSPHEETEDNGSLEANEMMRTHSSMTKADEETSKMTESETSKKDFGTSSMKEVEKTKEQMKTVEKIKTEKVDEVEEKMKVNKEVEKVVDKVMEESNKKDTNETEKTEEKVNVQKGSESPNEVKPVKGTSGSGLMPLEHFSGMTDSSIKIKGKESTTQMIIFNGLYYKGEWEIPFERKPADMSRVFYKSENEKIMASTIHSQGLFNTGEISNLDCKAIELPYKGGRYSLLVLVPNSRNGLTKLISDLSGYPLRNIYDQLTEKLVDVCLPSFEINTISKPVSSLRKLGVRNVTSIFNPDTADLSKISTSSEGLYVEELVQMVTFKVEADYSKANFLTASIASSRSNSQSFLVNQPFLFYLRDNAEDLTIVNGKVLDPTPKAAFYFS